MLVFNEIGFCVILGIILHPVYSAFSTKHSASPTPLPTLDIGKELAKKGLFRAGTRHAVPRGCRAHVCGGQLLVGSGVIQSPNFPNNYPDNLDCVWSLSAPKAHNIRLQFLNFSVEPGAKCQYDFLEIRDGGDSTSNVLGKFCGNDIPNDLTSTGNVVTMTFHSDKSRNYTGFKIHYEALPDVCHSNPCLNGGKCNRTSDTYKCTCPTTHTGRNCEHGNCDCGDNSYACTRYGFFKKCYCKSGFVQIGDTCQNECDCGENSHGCAKYWNIIKCFCIKDHVQEGDTCVAACDCGKNSFGCFKRWNVVSCHCRHGYTQINNQCEEPAKTNGAINLLELGNSTATGVNLQTGIVKSEEKDVNDKRKNET